MRGRGKGRKDGERECERGCIYQGTRKRAKGRRVGGGKGEDGWREGGGKGGEGWREEVEGTCMHVYVVSPFASCGGF